MLVTDRQTDRQTEGHRLKPIHTMWGGYLTNDSISFTQSVLDLSSLSHGRTDGRTIRNITSLSYRTQCGSGSVKIISRLRYAL